MVKFLKLACFQKNGRNPLKIINKNSTTCSDDSAANKKLGDSPPQFGEMTNNIYLIDKKKSRCGKDIRRMVCECPYEPDDANYVGCEDDCLNR